MSPGDDDKPSVPSIDPFLAEDPAAHERERRRLEREAKRRGRDNRQSLASRVSGALDGAASKGREAIEHTRERAKSPEPAGEGVEPPPFRRTPAMPATAETSTPPSATPGGDGRVAAEVLMPRREVRRAPEDTSEGDALPPEPLVATPPRQLSESEEWSVPPPIDPPAITPGPTGDGGPPRRPGRTAGGGWTLWRRRLLAIAAIAVIASGAAYALSKAGGGDPAPEPKPAKNVKTTSVTIPEGLTAEEMATVAKDAGLKGSYSDAVKKAAKKVDLTKDGAPKGASLEGFLFPATYELEKGAPASDLVDKQLEAFDANLSEVDLSYAKKKNLSVFDVVTIASMIEREVQVPEERPIVAAVIYNRLQQGIALGIDATVRYALGNNFEDSLTEADLAIDSPYNTYKNLGLPAGPIANPGLDSLEAAANPTNDNFLYYVVKPGTCGEHTFTDNYDEFLAASADYDAAQAAAGGSPTEC